MTENIKSKFAIGLAVLALLVSIGGLVYRQSAPDGFVSQGIRWFGDIGVGGDITMENDETISNATDGYVQIGGFTALAEGSVQVATYGGTITCQASFQPITSTAVITNAVIADASVAGAVVVLSNENAGDDITILESGSNLQCGGAITLTGGAKDTALLLWDGAEWICLNTKDN